MNACGRVAFSLANNKTSQQWVQISDLLVDEKTWERIYSKRHRKHRIGEELRARTARFLARRTMLL